MSKKQLDPEMLKVLATVQRVTLERNAALAASSALNRAIAKLTLQRNAAMNGDPVPSAPVPPPTLVYWLTKRLQEHCFNGRLREMEQIVGAVWDKLFQEKQSMVNVMLVTAMLLHQIEQEMDACLCEVHAGDPGAAEEAALGSVCIVKHFLAELAGKQKEALP